MLKLNFFPKFIEEGDLRLISGSISRGRLEIYLKGNWISVCYNGFDVYEGDIACRQLKFLYSSAVGATQMLKYVASYVM